MRSISRPRRPRIVGTRVLRALGRIALLASVVFGLLLALPRSAHAVGSVTLSTREPVEVDGRWKLVMTMDYGSIPLLPHIPMIFTFEPKVLYERALTDKSPDKPVLTKMPLTGQTTINESMDVGFSDASGKVFKVTKFDFVIRRDHGFEAGEYDLKIKRSDDGAQVGQTMRLTLKGDNPVVDRRAITFAGEKPKKAGDKKPEAAPEDKKPEAAPEDKQPEGAKPDGAAPAPPPVEPKQGGCGCELAGAGSSGNLGALAALALVVGLALRRKR
jgi:MYXO-CTERM domain-containing protein